MSNTTNNNKFISILIALFAFFVLVFFTTNIYSNMQVNLDINKTNNTKIKKLDNKLTTLNSLKKEIEDKNSLKSKIVSKFTKDFSEDKIIDYINDYIENTNKAEGNTILKLYSISFSDKNKSELGFKEVNIDLKMKVSDIFVLKNLLDYLVSDDSKYSFFITDFNFSIEKSGPYKINIPLKMYIR